MLLYAETCRTAKLPRTSDYNLMYNQKLSRRLDS